MSGAAKRPYEDGSGGGHSSSSKYPREESDGYSKLSSAAANECHPPYDLSQDTRIAKIPRTEFRDPDRRSPLHSIFRIQQSSNDLHLSAAPDNRSESRDTKDNKDQKIEVRDVKTDPRELYADCRRDSHNIKMDKEARYVNRVDETKDSKYDRNGYSDFRGDIKLEKDVYGPSIGHLNWKESKEYYRGKRYPDAPVGSSMDPRIMSRATVQITAEIGKDGHATEERDYADAREAVEEKKIDSKGEDKFKEKERKRKDVKQREWGERDKEKSDHKSSFQVANSSSGPKESAKEDRDGERWERDRKDPFKEREKLRGKDKDNAKRESWTGVDKEVSICEKELGDGSIRIQNQESSASERKKHKEFDNWKTADKETRDRKKDRAVDGDGDKVDRWGTSFDKGSEDGCADVEGVIEREREAYDHGVQHHKRMHRSRGSPQVANREPCLRSRTQDNDGLPGKAESSYVIYKVGECMQELIKLWKEYDSSATEKNGEGFHSGPTLEIRIPAEHVIATNRQVRGGQLWGTDVYTVDSDLVAVLMHTGYCRLTGSPPPTAIQELRATIRVLPPQDCYVSTLRNNVRSRAWGAAIGCSYRMESCCIVKKGGGTIDLEPCLTHTSSVEPTLAPVAVERTMTTRAAASNALRQQRFIREITIQYNLCNEPWIKYSISIVADKGLKKPQYTSARLKKGEVLYLETHSCRYELSFTGEKIVKSTPLSQRSDAEIEKSQNVHPHISNGVRNDGDNIMIDMYRWSRCKKILPQMAMREVGIPLSLDYVEVLEENVDWEDVQWSQTGVWVAGKEYVLARVHFLSMD